MTKLTKARENLIPRMATLAIEAFREKTENSRNREFNSRENLFLYGRSQHC